MAESYLEKSIWSIWTTNIISGWMVSHIQILLSLSIGYKLDSHSTYFHTAVYLIGTVLSLPMNRTATAIESSPVRNWISSSFCASVGWRSTATDPSIWKWSVILHGVLKLSEMNVGCLRQELFCKYIYIFFINIPDIHHQYLALHFLSQHGAKKIAQVGGQSLFLR